MSEDHAHAAHLAIGLLVSMVNCGESHTPQSEEMVNQGREAIRWLERELTRLRAENERLRQVFIPCDQTIGCAICNWIDWPDDDGVRAPHPPSCPVGFLEAERDRFEAENERLRATVEKYEARDPRNPTPARHVGETIDRLRTELEQLREENERLRTTGEWGGCTTEDRQALAERVREACAQLIFERAHPGLTPTTVLSECDQHCIRKVERLARELRALDLGPLLDNTQNQPPKEEIE